MKNHNMGRHILHVRHNLGNVLRFDQFNLTGNEL